MTRKTLSAIALVFAVALIASCVPHKPAASSVNSATTAAVEPEDGQTPATVYAVALCGQSPKGMDIEVAVPATGFKATIFNLCLKGEQAAVYYRCTVPARKRVGGQQTEVIARARVHGGAFDDYHRAALTDWFETPMAFTFLISREEIPMPRCCSWEDEESWNLNVHRTQWPGTTEFTGPPSGDGSWSDNPACTP